METLSFANLTDDGRSGVLLHAERLLVGEVHNHPDGPSEQAEH